MAGCRNYGGCYVNTPVEVFRSNERCDTKRIDRCDPMYGTFSGNVIVAFSRNPGIENVIQEVMSIYWSYVEGKFGKLSNCQIKAISHLYGWFLQYVQVVAGPYDQIVQVLNYYVDAIVYHFGNTNTSDDCKAILSAVYNTVGPMIFALVRNPDIDTLILFARRSIARSIAASPCCCSKNFINAVLGNPLPPVFKPSPVGERLLTSLKASANQNPYCDKVFRYFVYICDVQNIMNIFRGWS